MSAPRHGLAVLVADRRAELGLSFRDVAIGAGISLAAVHKIEHGKTGIPDQRTLEGLAAALQLPVQALLNATVGNLAGVHREHPIYQAIEGLDDGTLDAALDIVNSLKQGASVLVGGPGLRRLAGT